MLKAHQDRLDAFLAAAAIPDPLFAGLSATAVDPFLQHEKEELLAWQTKGQLARGPIQTVRVRVVSMTADTAVISGCEYSSSILVDSKTGQPVPGQPGGTQPEYDGFTETLVAVAPGQWRVKDSGSRLGSCDGY